MALLVISQQSAENSCQLPPSCLSQQFTQLEFLLSAQPRKSFQITKLEKTGKLVNNCLHSSYAVQIPLQFDEFLDNCF